MGEPGWDLDEAWVNQGGAWNGSSKGLTESSHGFCVGPGWGSMYSDVPNGWGIALEAGTRFMGGAHPKWAEYSTRGGASHCVWAESIIHEWNSGRRRIRFKYSALKPVEVDEYTGIGKLVPRQKACRP